MKAESNEKKKVLISVKGRRLETEVDEDALELCEEIKKEARALLGRLTEAQESEADIQRVNDFLFASIGKLAGLKFLKEVFGGCKVSTPELTEVLCTVISEVGGYFGCEK